MNECLVQKRICPRYPERMGEEMTQPSVSYSSTFTYMYLSTRVSVSKTTLWHLTLIFLSCLGPSLPSFWLTAPFPLLCIQPSFSVCNLSISWCKMCLYFMMYSMWHHCLITFHTHTYDLRNIPSCLTSYHHYGLVAKYKMNE